MLAWVLALEQVLVLEQVLALELALVLVLAQVLVQAYSHVREFWQQCLHQLVLQLHHPTFHRNNKSHMGTRSPTFEKRNS